MPQGTLCCQYFVKIVPILGCISDTKKICLSYMKDMQKVT